MDLRSELLGVIQHGMDSHPRSHQAELGPSEIGHPCPRWIAYTLSGHSKGSGVRSGAWRPTVGTAVHDWLADTLTAENERLGYTRYHVEKRVHVGTLEGENGYPIYGKCDLYVDGAVVDWKIVGTTTLRDARREKVSDQYRAQIHHYGRGWELAGYDVHTVAIFYLPSSGDLSDAHVYWEEYSPDYAAASLRSLNSIKALVDYLGTGAAAMLPGVAHYCHTCPFYSPGATDLTRACPGQEPEPYQDLATQLAGDP